MDNNYEYQVKHAMSDIGDNVNLDQAENHLETDNLNDQD